MTRALDWAALRAVAWRAARGCGLSPELADDVAQDAIVKLLTPRVVDQLEAYVHRVAVRLARRLAAECVEDGPHGYEAVVEQVEPEDAIDRARAVAAVTPDGVADARWSRGDGAARAWRSRARRTMREALAGGLEPPQGLSPRGGPPGSGAPTRRSGSHGKNFAG